MASMDITQCFRALDLEPGASLDEVKQNRNILCQVWHPDRFEPGSNLYLLALERQKKINVAYETLKKWFAQNQKGPPSEKGAAPTGQTASKAEGSSSAGAAAKGAGGTKSGAAADKGMRPSSGKKQNESLGEWFFDLCTNPKFSRANGYGEAQGAAVCMAYAAAILTPLAVVAVAISAMTPNSQLESLQLLLYTIAIVVSGQAARWLRAYLKVFAMTRTGYAAHFYMAAADAADSLCKALSQIPQGPPTGATRWAYTRNDSFAKGDGVQVLALMNLSESSIAVANSIAAECIIYGRKSPVLITLTFKVDGLRNAIRVAGIIEATCSTIESALKR